MQDNNYDGTSRMIKTFLVSTAMALMMTATAFAATTPPIRSGEYKAPTRAGYEFQGWYLNPECTGDMVIDKDGNWLVDIPEDAEVFAKWKQPPTTLIPGPQFNRIIKALANGSTVSSVATDQLILSFERSDAMPENSVIKQKISTDDSAYDVWAWFDNGKICWYSNAETIYFNPDSKAMFMTCSNIKSIDLSDFDTSEVLYFGTQESSNVGGIFDGCKNLETLDVSRFDTSKALWMTRMFVDCEKLTNIDVSCFDTSNVTKLGNMFSGCSSLTNINVSGFDTSNVTEMQGMFGRCSALNSLNVSNFDTSKVTNMESMFASCSKLTSLDVSNFDTSSVTIISTMFKNCSNLTSLNVSNFDTSKVTRMTNVFANCSNLTNLSGLSEWDTSNVTTMSSMFNGCSGLTSLDVSGWDTSKVTSMEDMFKNCTSFRNVALSTFNTSNVTNMKRMFSGCSSLISLDLSSFNTSKVTSTSNMFSGDSALTSIYVSELWSTAALTQGSSYNMFYGSSRLPNYNSTEIDKRRAYYGGDGKGYLTYKAAPTNP